MQKTKKNLSALEIKRIKEAGKHHVGDGLYLQVSKKGKRSWAFRYYKQKKAHWMGLGAYPLVSIADARAGVLDSKRLLLNDIDPLVRRAEMKHERCTIEAKTKSFDECSEAFIDAQKSGWSNEKHVSQWINTLATYASPVIGDMPVSKVETEHVLAVLKPIWDNKNETASRLRGRIESILSWATVNRLREGVNPAQWRGHLDKLLPKPSRVHSTNHFTALPYPQLFEFMAHLRTLDSVSAKALEFNILTLTRTSETLKATWDEINFNEAFWLIPKERTKQRKELKVPLSKDALGILKIMQELQTNRYIFPGKKLNCPLSGMSLLMVHRRMGYKITTHGFRSTFRDWAAEKTNFSREVVEMALGHSVGGKVENAYRRSDLFNRRVELMSVWASFCSTPYPKGASILAIPQPDAVKSRLIL